MYGGSGTWPWRSMSALGVRAVGEQAHEPGRGAARGRAAAVGRVALDARAEAGRDVDDACPAGAGGPAAAGRPRARGRAARTSSSSAAPPPAGVPSSRAGKTRLRLRTSEVARAQQLGQLAEAAVRDRAARALEHEQARGVALGERLLRDQLGRQLVVVGAEVMSRSRPIAARLAGHPRQKSFFCGAAGLRRRTGRPRCS